jgi:hypothetical protein
VADRLRAEGVDRRRRGKDRCAGEESGELRTEYPDGDGTHSSIEATKPNRRSPDVDSDHPTGIRSHQTNALDWSENVRR